MQSRKNDLQGYSKKINMSQKLLITNCKLFDAADNEQTTSILIENGIITQIGQINSGIYKNILDAHGRIIAPGFIDIHIQGAGGADVLDATPEALKAISQTCARFGTTSFLATTVFKPNQENQHVALAAQYVGRDLGGANLLGIHLEGPFISPQKRGMILPECICPPSLQLLDKIQDVTKGRLKIMTIAPELSGNLQIIRRLIDSNIIASFGHSNATYEQTLDGFAAGVSHVTHLSPSFRQGT
jgi:N-acetylglucosamine-6-phosphate deacetylase